jgi:hypothetical protein
MYIFHVHVRERSRTDIPPIFDSLTYNTCSIYSIPCLKTLPINRTTIYKLVRFKDTDQEYLIMF